MTERRKDLLFLGALLAVLILLFARILFTDKIIRAPDITAEFYWMVKGFKEMGLRDLLTISLHPDWNLFVNSGATDGGANLPLNFLFYRTLIFWLVPQPANIAWFIVFHLFFGAAGAYLCCRAVGCSRPAALLGGLIFAVAPENASLINAGHVQKIATISFAPWAFYFFERGFQTRRIFFFLATGVVLALQFFNMHWQIAYYTCLGIGVYGVFRSLAILRGERREKGKTFGRLLVLNLATMFFFLSTVAISLLPVADWSRDTTRGSQSAATQGAQGGFGVDEAMSWSLPPEELASFVIPGFFGFSRQEGGYTTPSIGAYYWGRMVFTQTTDYMGLLPWLLLPLPLIFRRDRYTWLACGGIVFGILFSMGKYTPFYWFLYEHFPGINHFRVPKMMMFLPVLGLGVLAARGLDLLCDAEVRRTSAFRRYLAALLSLPAALLLLWGAELAGKSIWLQALRDIISQPNRFEMGPQLIAQRWNNLVTETGIAAVVAAVYAGALFFAARSRDAVRLLPLLLILCYLADTGRVNGKFMLLQPLPHREMEAKTPAIAFLAQQPREYRTLPMNGADPMKFVANNVPVFFTSNPIQMQRWQNYLDTFTLTSAMPDIMNVRYIVVGRDQLAQVKGELGEKFSTVFQSPDGSEIVLQNRSVLPKAWLVPAAQVASDPLLALRALQSPAFDPRRVALVESPPPLPLPPEAAEAAGTVAVNRYEGNVIGLTAAASRPALLVVGEKYARGWRATVDGRKTDIHPVDYILRGVYLAPGNHTVEFVFDPLPSKVGKYLTLVSFVLFALLVVREAVAARRRRSEGAAVPGAKRK